MMENHCRNALISHASKGPNFIAKYFA